MPPPTPTIEILQCGHSTTHAPLLLSPPRSNQHHRRQAPQKKSKKRARANISRALSAFLLAHANAGPAPVRRRQAPSPGRREANSTSYIAPDDAGSGDDDDDDGEEEDAGVGATQGEEVVVDDVSDLRHRQGAVEETTLAAAAKEEVRPVFVYLRGNCPRGGCRGLSVVRQGQEAYDDHDAEDLRYLWENLLGLAGRAEVGIVGARDTAVDAEEEKRRDADDATVGQRCRPTMARIPLGHRRRSGPLHRSVRHYRGSCRARRDAAALTGLYGQLQVIRETEVSSSFEVTAGRHHLLGPSRLVQLVLSDAKHIDAETAAGQLLAAVIWLEQAELLRATRAPKGWFEACLQHTVEELEGAEGTVSVLEELQRT